MEEILKIFWTIVLYVVGLILILFFIFGLRIVLEKNI